MDKGANAHIQDCISYFLDWHGDIKKILLNKISPAKVNDYIYPAGDLLNMLARSIATATVGGPKPTLLVLVDEYDKPMCDVLFDLIYSNTPALRTTLQKKVSSLPQLLRQLQESPEPGSQYQNL
eukprot:scaffold574477_cov142-Attheya_sp.AAC.1